MLWQQLKGEMRRVVLSLSLLDCYAQKQDNRVLSTGQDVPTLLTLLGEDLHGDFSRTSI